MQVPGVQPRLIASVRVQQRLPAPQLTQEEPPAPQALSEAATAAPLPLMQVIWVQTFGPVLDCGAQTPGDAQG